MYLLLLLVLTEDRGAVGACRSLSADPSGDTLHLLKCDRQAVRRTPVLPVSAHELFNSSASITVEV